MNEDFQVNIWIESPCRHNHSMQIRQSILIVILEYNKAYSGRKQRTTASITNIRAPISPNIEATSHVLSSEKSIWPGKSQTWKSMKELNRS